MKLYSIPLIALAAYAPWWHANRYILRSEHNALIKTCDAQGDLAVKAADRFVELGRCHNKTKMQLSICEGQLKVMRSL